MSPTRAAAIVLAALAAAGPARGQPAAPSDTLTLQEALAEARAADIRLSVSRLALEQALDRVRQARGALWPSLSMEADLHPGAPRSYESSDARARLVAQTPLYDGGALRASVRSRRARSEAARADYRGTVKDVELAVRADFAQLLRRERDIELQRRGVARLERYLSEVRARRASGQGVGADVTRTRSELAGARADLDAAKHARTEIRMELNDLLGRTPDAPLAPAPLPEPTEPPSPAPPGETPWTLTPDVRSALSSVDAARATLSGTRSGRLPHLGLAVAAGGQAALVDPAPALMNDGRGWGVEAMLTLSLPLWDRVYRGRMDEARDALAESRAVAEATRRSVRLEYHRADALLRARWREIATRREAASSARDAFVQAESLYRGGSGTALDVLDAYRSWRSAAQAVADAVLDYRLADARRIRWGTK
ncbi:MAG TPA: TolC family protein [Gemmatimonadota bacterium]|nr:TolC family protein [Gemmatimonadota bacterium]